MFSSVSVTHYLTAPKVRSVLSGVCFDDYALAVDDFDTSDKSDTPIIEIDPQGLVPTQDDVEEDHVIRLAKVPSVELPCWANFASSMVIIAHAPQPSLAARCGRGCCAWMLDLLFRFCKLAAQRRHHVQ